jgi:ABC-type glycerol-3-phosphate transport system substrate-binding protein
MRTLRALALIPALGLALVACGSDDAAAPDTTQPATTVASTCAETTTGGADTTAGSTETSTAATDGGPVQSGPVQIDVVVGTNSGPDRVEKVAVGSDITLNITNPDADDEYHVHVIDLEQKAPKGEMATMNFTVDQPGTYEVESHVTEDVLLVIEVR